MQPLTARQKSYLKSLANQLKPVIFIGKSGLDDSVLQATQSALDDHELIKVKFLEFKEEKNEMCHRIARDCQCQQVGMVGHVALFYRKSSKPEKTKIVLPGS
jgi:RNA-binding protein